MMEIQTNFPSGVVGWMLMAMMSAEKKKKNVI